MGSAQDQCLFSLFHAAGGVRQGLIDVSRFQLRVGLQDPLAAAAAGDQPHDRAHRDAQPADAGLAAHHGGIVADAGEGHGPRLRTKALVALLWIRLEPR